MLMHAFTQSAINTQTFNLIIADNEVRLSYWRSLDAKNENWSAFICAPFDTLFYWQQVNEKNLSRADWPFELIETV